MISIGISGDQIQDDHTYTGNCKDCKPMGTGKMVFYCPAGSYYEIS